MNVDGISDEKDFEEVKNLMNILKLSRKIKHRMGFLNLTQRFRYMQLDK